MKSNWKYFGTLALVLAFAVGTVAHGGDDHKAKMKAEVGLSDAQVQQLEAKFAELKPLKEKAMAIKGELKALEGAATPDQKAIGAKKAELETVKKEWSAKSDSIYRSVMSKEQYAKFQAWQERQEKEYTASKKH